MRILTLVPALMICTASATTNANSDLPPSIKKAFAKVHRTAQSSSVRNLFMFNYAYYAKGLCKDQDCSEGKIQTEMNNAQAKMGDDFAKHLLNIDDYGRAIAFLQSKLAKGDLATVNGDRTYQQNLRAGVFVSCIDYAKAVMGKAIDYGFPKDDIKIYVTMNKDAYKVMCPAADGRAPVLPRPVVHTLIAYLNGGEWFALNVEDPDAIPIKIGTQLPDRLSREHQFTFPALVAYQKLIYAGSYPAESFINGFPYSWLVSITADGRLETDPSIVKCE